MNSKKNRTGYFYSYNYRKLFYQSWTIDDPRGVVIVVHGLSENTDRYSELAKELNKEGWSVYAFDIRGHGRSPGIRGYVRKFRLFERDLVYFSNFVLEQQKKQIPYVYFGYSLGGLIVCRSLDHEEDIVQKASGICLVAPALGLLRGLSLLRLIILSVLPLRYNYYKQIVAQQLTNHPFYQNEIRNDRFRHTKISSAIYISIIKYRKLVKKKRKIHPHLFLQLAGKDVIVDNKMSLEYFNHLTSIRSKKLSYYPSGMHQIIEDLVREDAIRDIKGFLRFILE